MKPLSGCKFRLRHPYKDIYMDYIKPSLLWECKSALGRVGGPKMVGRP